MSRRRFAAQRRVTGATGCAFAQAPQIASLPGIGLAGDGWLADLHLQAPRRLGASAKLGMCFANGLSKCRRSASLIPRGH